MCLSVSRIVHRCTPRTDTRTNESEIFNEVTVQKLIIVENPESIYIYIDGVYIMVSKVHIA